MAVTACDYNNKVSTFFEKWSRLWRMYASPAYIFSEYKKLDDTKWIMETAYKTTNDFVNKIKKWWTYNKIWTDIVSPSLWKKWYADKIQKAVNWYIADAWSVQRKKFKVIKSWWNATEWAWNKWLSPSEQQFVMELAMTLERFWLSIQSSNTSDNLKTMLIWCVNNNILWHKLNDKPDTRWTALWNFFWVVSASGWWNNNALRFLWKFDGNDQKYKLTLADWTTKDFEIKDLYSSDDATMQELFWLLFADDNDHWNDPILQSPSAYRNAIKNFMEATDKDKEQLWIEKFVNWMLKWWAMWKLSSYFFNMLAWWASWLSCLTTWYLNVISYKEKNSKTKINDALTRLWLKKDYFKMKDIRSQEDLKNWYQELWQNFFWLWTKDLFFKDYTRDNFSLINNEMFSWLFMWPMNIMWDTIWRWDYQQKAMDMALQKLWRDWNLENRLYMTTSWGKRVPNEAAFVLLMNTFLEKMADMTWFPSIEWWWQLIWRYDYSNGKWKRTKATVNSALKMFHWMSSWWTNHVNNIYKILMWWAVNAFTTQEEKDNAYKWCWWNWLIRRYTRAIETWEKVMPWEHAQALVSKREFGREIMRIIAWLRNVYRFWNLWCRDDETWDLDIWCAFKNYLSVAYLPYQALQIAHPMIRALWWMITDSIHYSNYFKDKDLWVDDADVIKWSAYQNFIKPLLRSAWAANIFFQSAERAQNTDDNFVESLWNSLLHSSDWMIYWISDQISSYVHSEWAYWEKSYLNDDMTVFWSNVPIRDTLNEMNNIKWIESVAKWWLWQKVWWMNGMTRFFYNLVHSEEKDLDASWLYESEKVEDLLRTWNDDPDLLEMAHGKFTDEMKDDDEFMQYVWTNLTQDRQTYWADFKEWVRDSKYNQTEINYAETLLKKDMDEIAVANPWLSDLEIYDAALKKFFESWPTYDLIKDAIQTYDDAWESAMWVYTDYLSNAAWLTETAWVKWLALVAEYRKRELMEKAWIQYSSKQTASEKATLEEIEKKVAWELWPYLWLADRRQYYNLMWEWFLKDHPEYKNYDPFSNLLDKDWNININADLKTSWTIWVALWANNLARTELIIWDTNWYELSNVFTEKFWSAIDENWNFDDLKAAQMIDAMIYFSNALEESWKLPADIALILAPTLTKNLQLWDYVLSTDNEQNKKLLEILWEEWVDQIRWLLYDTYSAINDLPELLDELNNEDVIDKILWAWNKKYSRWWWGGSLYHWNNTRKNYDYYSKPANAFNGWWSKNLSKLANWYGKSWKTNRAWNYSAREFYFLNQRSYRNNIDSTRIAPDIPLSIWGFSKTTVKSKNPVSWFTTNIKPWEKRSTAKFGKSKSIVWWEWSRWPVSSFKA